MLSKLTSEGRPMSTQELEQPLAETTSPSPAPLVIIVSGLVMGLIGDVLFYHSEGPGINVPIFIGLGFGVMAALIYIFRPPLYIPNMLFVIPALFCAVALSVLDSPQLNFFNFFFLVLCLLIVVSFGKDSRFLGGDVRVTVVRLFESGIGGVMLVPILMLDHAIKWLEPQTFDPESNQKIRAILRGCLLALPIVIVFALLLGSADVVFGDILEEAYSIFYIENWQTLVSHLVLIGLLAWGVIFGLGMLLQTNPEPNSPEYPSLTESFRLGFIETTIVLGSLNLLFLFFVIIQAAYLFGGESNITSQGYTYSEYARRGFFELLAVSMLTMSLIVGARLIHKPENPRQEQVFQGLSIGLILMTLVMLVSAHRRLSLYEDAYGYTHLRVVSHVFIVWLGMLFLILIADLLKVYPQLFWMGGVAVAVGFWVSLNIMNLDALIAERNIERYARTDKLDTVYLFSLSDDAVPAMIQLLDDESKQHQTRVELGYRLYQLDRYHERRGLAGYNFSKERAWRVLDERREDLGDFIQPARYYSAN